MQTFRAFLSDVKGSVSILASVSMLSFIGVTGAAMDYSTATRQKAFLQSVIDSTATALALDPEAPGMNTAEINRRALQYAQSVAEGQSLTNLSLKAIFSKDKVTIDATAEVPLFFGQMVGMPKAQIASAVTVERAQSKKLHVALVLDNTGSMRGEKLAELKKAVKYFLGELETMSKTGAEVRVAMVPFGRTVRVNPAHMQPSWVSGGKWGKWKGCLTDRDQPYDTNDESPAIGNDRRFPMTDDDDCGDLATIVPLTNDLTSLRNQVDALVAGGNTNVTIGVAWGMAALSPGNPLPEAAATTDTEGLVKVMIVLTDGENTENRWGRNDGGAIDKRTLLACETARKSGQEIFTIRLIEGNEAILRECAKTPGNYYNVKNASQLTNIFQNLAGNLRSLRFTR